MDSKVTRFLVAFAPIIVLLALLLVGMLTLKGDARYYPAASVMGLAVLWSIWQRYKDQSARLTKAKSLALDEGSSALELMALAIEAYESSPESRKTREMLRLTYRKMIAERNLIDKGSSHEGN